MKWSEKDFKLLRELYPDKSIDKKEIEKRLKRSWETISWHARKIGLTLRTDVNYWTPEDEEKLAELSQNPELRAYDIGKLLNRSGGSVRAKISDMLIKRPKRGKKALDLDNVEEHLYD